MNDSIKYMLIAKRICLFVILGMSAVVSEVQASDPNNGRILYMQHCNSCHEPGREVAGAPDFNMGMTLMQSDVALLEKIRSGKNAMPGYIGILTDRMILDIIAYMRTF